MFRRPRFRPIRRILDNEMPPALEKANHLKSSGNFSEAAVAFEGLAHGAQARGIPQDAQLFLEAAHCRIKAHQIDQAMVDLRQGLGIISTRRNFVRFQQICRRFIEELTSTGYPTEAQEVSKLLGTMAEIVPSEIHNELKVSSGKVPSKCTSCGGDLRSDEVDRIDDFSVECPWCGTTIRCE